MDETNIKPKKTRIDSKILKAAEKVFLDKGFRLATIDEISNLAELTKRTMYKHFPSKLSLFISMIDSQLTQLRKELANVQKKVTSSSGISDIEQSIKVLFDFTLKNEKFMKLYWMLDTNEFEGEIPADLISHVDKLSAQTFKLNRILINKAIEEKKIAQVDPDLLIHLFSAINKGIFIHANKEKRLTIADINPQDLFDLLLFILKNGLFSADKKGGVE